MPDGTTPLLLRQDSAAGATRLTLNRPDSRNALSFAMLGALLHALEEIAQDDAVRVVVLAAGGPVFCAGHDLREITAHRNDEDAGRGFYTAAMQRCAAVMQTIVALPQPVIAEVQGIATAAGCQLVASCDLAVASEAAKFCTPGVDIGLFCSTPAVALSRAVPAKPALEMLLTGQMVPAAEAQRIGLVNRVVPAAQLTEATTALAEQIAARSAHTVRLGKAAFHRQRNLPLDQAYAHCAAVMTDNLLAADAEEGIGAFLAKRSPVWQDR
ncbi:enoyl-CoA hydratase [Roseomonas frigidaquae]|uniref:Enoyl-CoA hydratase domain-containing protein 3, mitochondrial n=1 Tax=Falsiroseomonas frigidaquae TaxID=487318 RepID=A0ABX1EST7_9PROT|nr:enoyl-CoA hydratase [Falsiroseomonas frigidaquae]NKE43203.1 enoyl-CoA hydratase [Falsiroseomonas frigidaquae]